MKDKKNDVLRLPPLIRPTTDWENQISSVTHEVWDGEKWVEEPLTNAQIQELNSQIFKPDSGAIFQIRAANELD